MLSSYWDTGIYQPTLFGANVLPRAFCSSPPVHLPHSPALPAQPALSAPPLLSMWVLPNPKSDQWRKPFTRILKKGKEGRGRKQILMGKIEPVITASNIFFSIFYYDSRIQYKSTSTRNRAAARTQNLHS